MLFSHLGLVLMISLLSIFWFLDMGPRNYPICLVFQKFDLTLHVGMLARALEHASSLGEVMESLLLLVRLSILYYFLLLCRSRSVFPQPSFV